MTESTKMERDEELHTNHSFPCSLKLGYQWKLYMNVVFKMPDFWEHSYYKVIHWNNGRPKYFTKCFRSLLSTMRSCGDSISIKKPFIVDFARDLPSLFTKKNKIFDSETRLTSQSLLYGKKLEILNSFLKDKFKTTNPKWNYKQKITKR